MKSFIQPELYFFFFIIPFSNRFVLFRSFAIVYRLLFEEVNVRGYFKVRRQLNIKKYTVPCNENKVKKTS